MTRTVPEATDDLGLNLSALDDGSARLASILTRPAEGTAVRGGAGEGDVLRLRSATGAFVACHGRDPGAEANRLLGAALPGRDLPPVLLAIGLSLGYVLDEIDRRSATARVIAIEPEPDGVRWLLSRRDWRAWLTTGRLTLLLGPDYAGVADAWRALDAGAPEPPVIVNPVLARERTHETARALEVARRIVFDARANAEARRRLGSTYLLNTLRNLGAIVGEADVRVLTGRFPNVPAILVGAGPSLDRNVESLRKVGDRALVIAADTALRPLGAHSLVPQIVVTADPTEENARHLILAEPGSPQRRPWLVAEGSVASSSFQISRGKAFTFRIADHEPWPWLRSLGVDCGELRIWGSVLTAAFDLAVKAGCNPIVFTGADLAYTDGRPYCRSTSFEASLPEGDAFGPALDRWSRELMDQFRAATAEDIHGRPTRTAPHLVAFRDWIVEETGRLIDREVVNATGDGILHGRRITQGTVEAALEGRPAPGCLRGVLEDAHRASRSSPAVREAVGAAADAAIPKDLMQRWVHFTSGGARADELAAALSHGADALAGRQHVVSVSSSVVRHLTPGDLGALCETVGRAAVSLTSGSTPASDLELTDAASPFTPPLGPDPLEPMHLTPLVRHVLSPDRIEHEDGHCVRFRFRTVAGQYFSYSPVYARLPLFEDGLALPAPGTLHDEIRRSGGGRYSMWPGGIYFSSSDAADPRTGGHVYHVLVPPYVAFLEQLPASIITRFNL